MPIPKPTPSENDQDYMNRCISMLINEGTDEEQAIAICISNLENNKKEFKSMKLIEKIKNLFNEEFKTAEIEGVGTIEYSTLEIGAEIFIVKDEVKEPIADGEYVIENQKVKVEGGKITEVGMPEVIEEPKTDEPTTEVEVEMEKVEEPIIEEPKKDEEVLSIQEENDIRISKLEQQISEISTALDTLLVKIEGKFSKFEDEKSKLKLEIENKVKEIENLNGGTPVTQFKKVEVEEKQIKQFSKLSDFYKSQK